jgi:hypothetical protein
MKDLFQIYALLLKYITTMPTDKYEIGIIWKQIKLPGNPIPKSERVMWSSEELLSNISLLIERNTQSYEIFARPADKNYVLLDDVERQMLSEIAKIKPCLLMETSQDNYQVWLRVKGIPKEHDRQQSVWRELAARFNADPGSAKPGQLGRLPGFVNRKPKYFPNFPEVKLHKYAERFSTIDLNELMSNMPTNYTSESFSKKNDSNKKQTGDRSAFDFAICCSGIERGFSDEKIAQYLTTKSEKARQRGKIYIETTIQNAKKTVSTAKNPGYT